jgi:hypothetical protein
MHHPTARDASIRPYPGVIPPGKSKLQVWESDGYTRLSAQPRQHLGAGSSGETGWPPFPPYAGHLPISCQRKPVAFSHPGDRHVDMMWNYAKYFNALRDYSLAA